MITVKNLKKVYGNYFELNIERLEIIQGESFGLVGNNGAGKTTLFNLILDLIPATDGKVLSKNETVAGSDQWKKYTGSYIDTRFLIGFLTPREYLDFAGSLYGYNREDIENTLDRYKGFIDDQLLTGKRLIRDLSLGNKTRVGILAALMVEPEVVILDEPFAHLDPTSQSRLENILHSIKEENGATLLISSHDLKHITDVCDRIAVLDDGKIKKDIKTNAETLAELEDFFAV
jgi:ABC-2 type transport system ATP-binding protein